ncbi:hypothetical protein Godav_015092 [Gossypium davidsonii]|uniref:Phospholipid scramblase n=1 Tax=Gossypium davidsonii TaxID=34287 RepID=A0A7J8RMP2_GOSDV|nr:hypothetical protein [Gossypium davidsonii]
MLVDVQKVEVCDLMCQSEQKSQIFTDAGQYVIRFGKADPVLKTGPASMIQELDVSRPLTLSERAIALALAISLDNDYFSRHGGW